MRESYLGKGPSCSNFFPQRQLPSWSSKHDLRETELTLQGSFLHSGSKDFNNFRKSLKPTRFTRPLPMHVEAVRPASAPNTLIPAEPPRRSRAQSSAELAAKDSEHINCQKEMLQTAELPSGCAVGASLQLSWAVCHSCWVGFGDAAIFESIPASHRSPAHWSTKLVLVVSIF